MSKEHNKNSKWKIIGKRILYTYLIINSLIWLFSPIITKYYLSNFLQEIYQLELSENSHIRFNPFLSHLTIEDLVVSKNGIEVLKIGAANFEVRTHRLIALQLYVSELQIDRFTVLSEFTQHGIVVAGVALDKLLSEAENEIKVVEDLEDKFDLTIIIPKIILSNSGMQLNFKQKKTVHHFKIDQLTISDITISNTEQFFESRLEGKINGASYKVNLEIDLQKGKGFVKNEFYLQGFDISHFKQFLSDEVQMLSGSLNIESSNEITISPQSIEVSTKVLNVENANFEFRDSRVSFIQKNQKLSVQELETKIENGEKNITIGNVSLIGSDFTLADSEMQLRHAGQNLRLSEIALTQFLNNTLDLFIDKLTLELDGMEASTKAMSFTQEELSINLGKVSYDRNNLAKIQRVNLERLNGVISINPKEKSDELKSELESTNDKEIIVGQEEPGPPNVLQLMIDKIVLSNSKKLVFIDKTVIPEYQKELIIDTFEISDVNSLQIEMPSAFMIKGSSDKYSKFNFSGNIQPFTKLINLKLKGVFNEISLPPANGYIQQTMGFQFKHGELDTAFDIEIKDSSISGNTEIKIRGLEMDSAENYDQDVIQEQTALPLNVALGMLKDGDDNVVLDIPMSGNVDSPSFGMSSFIGLVTKKAIQAAAKSYILKTFIPYAELLSVTISAGSFIMETSFEDLPYAHQQIEIPKEQTAYMTQFIALMKEKGDTQVKVCAIATIDELTEQQKTSLNQTEKAKILEIYSKSRMEFFKEYVVNAGIESSRILLCSPKVDLNDGVIPILSLSI